MIKRRLCLLWICSVLLLSNCSAPAAVAGGSDNPDFAIGVAVTSDGKPAAGALVECASSDYNPLRKSGVIASAITNSEGRFSIKFPAKGEITITVYHKESGERRLAGTVSSNTGASITLDTLKTGKPASVILMISDSAVGDSGYIPGTSILFTVSDSSPVPGYRQIVIDSLPPGLIPPLALENDGAAVRIITDSIDAVSGQDTSIMCASQENRPLWKIKTALGIRMALMESLGGGDSAAKAIRDQIGRANRAFADPRLKGALAFSIDSIFYFNGTAAEQQVTRNGYFSLLVTDEPLGLADFSMNSLSVVHSPVGKDLQTLFSKSGDWSLIGALAVSRGCFDRRSAEINAAKNPVDGMGYGYGSPTYTTGKGEGFTDYDIYFLNDAKANPSFMEAHFASNSADTSGVKLSRNGIPLSGWDIQVYGLNAASGTVESSPFLSGKTNSAGEFSFGRKPFSLGANYTLNYSAVLVKFSNGSNSYTQWISFEVYGDNGIKGNSAAGSRYFYPVYYPE